MRQKWVGRLAILVFVAMVAASCTGDDGGGGTTAEGPDFVDEDLLADAVAIAERDEVLPPCQIDGFLVENQAVAVVNDVFADLFDGQPEAGEFVTFYPGGRLEEVLARAEEAFDVEGLDREEEEEGRAVLARLGISPNNQVFSNPRLNGGPATDPMAVNPPEDTAAVNDGDQRVLVIDTGIDPNNPLGLVGDADPFLATSPFTSHIAGHGNFAGGIVALHGPGASEIMGADLFMGANDVYDRDLVNLAAKLAADEDGFDAANLSFGGYPCGATADIEQNPTDNPVDYVEPVGQRIALELLAGSGIELMAAAAGNDHTDRPFFPAAFYSSPTPTPTDLVPSPDYPGDPELFGLWARPVPLDLTGVVMSIGASPVKVSSYNIEYSNFGSWVAVKDVEGCQVSAMPEGFWMPLDDPPHPGYDLDSGWAWWCGTSFATPYWLAGQL